MGTLRGIAESHAREKAGVVTMIVTVSNATTVMAMGIWLANAQNHVREMVKPETTTVVGVMVVTILVPVAKEASTVMMTSTSHKTSQMTEARAVIQRAAAEIEMTAITAIEQPKRPPEKPPRNLRTIRVTAASTL